MSGETVCYDIRNPQWFLLELSPCLSDMGNNHGKESLRNLKNGVAIAYIRDLGRSTAVPTDWLKLRVYDGAREFRRNYKTVLRTEKSPQ